MSWETKTVMEQRTKFVAEATEGTATISALCRKYGISRKTGYKWLNRAADRTSILLKQLMSWKC